jgi:predicted transcriptional regulator
MLMYADVCRNTSPESLRLLTDVEHAEEVSMNETDQDVIRKVHTLLKSEDGLLSQEGLAGKHLLKCLFKCLCKSMCFVCP